MEQPRDVLPAPWMVLCLVLWVAAQLPAGAQGEEGAQGEPMARRGGWRLRAGQGGCAGGTWVFSRAQGS